MAGPSPPIDITPPSRFPSNSPANRTSNLTSALHQANANMSNGHAHPGDPLRADDESRLWVGRQDSLGELLDPSQAGARPISMSGKPRRESMAGSFMSGMSWGGVSVGSFIQDDIAMGGTSPGNMQSPSYYSSSYLPKMEANFWTNLKCCDTIFNDLHELLSHFESVHSQQPSNFPYRSSMSLPRRKSSFARSQAEQSQIGAQIRGFNVPFDRNGTPHRGSPMTGAGGYQRPSVSDMDTIGEMEMDEEQPNDYNQTMNFQQPTNPLTFTPQQNFPNPNYSLANDDPQTSNFSNASTPPASQANFQNQRNPMVSAVNTPNLDSRAQQIPNANGPLFSPTDKQGIPGVAFPAGAGLNSQLMDNLNNGFDRLDFNQNAGMFDTTIDQPARNLYSENNGLGNQPFGFPGNGVIPEANANQGTVQGSQMNTGINGFKKLPGDEERPFRCPVIGCEKAYKNANGLRYHEKHGHSNQKLQENSDGTMSIVDPETSIPYPGTVGMEKEKPYRCEHCGKRYKNLNGLKYHRKHSPPCNPEFNFSEVPLNVMQPTMTGESSVY